MAIDRIRIAGAIGVALMLLSGHALAHEKLITLYVFSGNGGGGAEPEAGITVDATDNLFGTTYLGGNAGCTCGTIFEVSPIEGGGWNTTTLYSFQDGQDGGYPQSPLAMDRSGALYGSTMAAANAPGGNAYRLIPQQGGGWTFETLYAFQGTSDGYINPYAPVIAHDHSLYGITLTGGGTGCGGAGCGTLFKLVQPENGNTPWRHVVLFSFPGGDGGSVPQWIVPSGKKNGAVYVATSDGSGAIVRLAPSLFPGGGWTESVLYRFAGGKDGFGPSNLVVGADGTIFGTGGIGTSQAGIVFALTLSGNPDGTWTKTTLHEFKGYGPTALTTAPGGALVGVTFGDFDFNAGTVFGLAPGNPWTYTRFYDFNRGAPSRNPENVVFGKGGHLYGVLNGGDSNDGAVFELR